MFRPNSAVVIFDRALRVLACERIDLPGALQFVQGGVDPGETALQAAVRELHEEIGLGAPLQASLLTLVGEVPGGPYRYEFPPGKGDFFRAKGFVGQEQSFFLFYTEQPDAVVANANLSGSGGEAPEFSSVQFLAYDAMLPSIWAPKRPVIEAMMAHALPIMRAFAGSKA